MARALILLGVIINYQEGRAAGVPIVRQSLALARACDDTRSITEALAWLAEVLYHHNHDYEQARASYEEALTLLRELGDVAGLTQLLSHMAQVAAWSCDFARAHQWLYEAQMLNAQLRVIGDVVDLYDTLGVVALKEGQYLTAQAAFEESLALDQASGGGPGAWTLSHLGYAVLGLGDRARAYALFAESVQGFRQGPQTLGVAYALEGVAKLVVLQGQPKRAVRLYAWCWALRESLDVGRYPVEQDEVDRDFVAIHAQLDDATFAAAWTEGKGLTMGQAIAEVLNH
jgi:tetratricopeptide (TPR) repeat protein